MRETQLTNGEIAQVLHKWASFNYVASPSYDTNRTLRKSVVQALRTAPVARQTPFTNSPKNF